MVTCHLAEGLQGAHVGGNAVHSALGTQTAAAAAAAAGDTDAAMTADTEAAATTAGGVSSCGTHCDSKCARC